MCRKSIAKDISVWNANLTAVNSATPQDVSIELKGSSIATDGTVTTLTGTPPDVNTLEELKNVYPATAKN